MGSDGRERGLREKKEISLDRRKSGGQTARARRQAGKRLHMRKFITGHFRNGYLSVTTEISCVHLLIYRGPWLNMMVVVASSRKTVILYNKECYDSSYIAPFASWTN